MADPGPFDVLVVGTGIGGATFGYALARAGRRVLFVEGGADLSSADTLRGSAPEALPGFARASEDRRRALLLRAGRNADSLEDAYIGDRLVPYIGHGAGGSSSLFGMVMERRRPHDFEGWPIGYRELAPWYEEAEQIYGVEEARSPLSAANQRLFAHLEARGFAPHRLHLASRRDPDCRACQGYLCPTGCKRDARVSCLDPSLATGNAHLAMNATVQRIEVSGRRATAAVVRVKGEETRIPARLFAVAAGALATPGILERSAIADPSGLNGRRLMRHAIDLFALALGPRFSSPAESKELGLHQYYVDDGNRLGTVQSFGAAPPLEYLRSQPGPNLWRALGPVAAPVSALFENAPIVASILPDSPSPENHVEGGRIFYRLSATDAERRAGFCRQVARDFRRFAPVRVRGTSNRKALGHVCGTAAFGDDPATSVLDVCNRVHSADNVYVVDASFFPTSGGVNPALTIAANALRVADYIHREAL